MAQPMCNLYRLDVPANQLAARFRAEPGPDPWIGGYVAPGKFAPVIVRGGGGERRIVPRQWGVPPPPKIAAAGGHPVTNVRNLESPFWIGTLRHREYRCLVPVTSFQEWSLAKDPTTGRKTQHWFALSASRLFAIAGIWRDSEVPSFAFLTCEPNRIVGAVHPKAMPLILHAEDEEAWLWADWKDAQKLVTPFPSQLMAASVGSPPARDLPEH
jgi:putative SOS response-associated peptidase YedK